MLGVPDAVQRFFSGAPQSRDPRRLSCGRCRFFQRAVEHLPHRSHERFAAKVFLVVGLFADQHRLRMLRAFVEHGLGRVLPKRVGAAIGGLFAQGFEAG